MAWRLSDLSIRTRLYVLLGIGIGGTALLLALATYALAEFRVGGPRHDRVKSTRALRAEVSPPTIYLSELYLVLQELETAKEGRAIDDGRQKAQAHIAKYKTVRGDVLARLPDGPLRRVIEDDVTRTAERVIDKAERYLSLLGKAKQEEVSAALREIGQQFQDHRRAVLVADDAVKDEVARLESSLAGEAGFYQWWLFVVSILSVALGGALGLATTRGVVASLARLDTRVKALASGAADLTARIPSDGTDELSQLGEGVNAVIARIQAIVAKVRESSLKLLSTASQIASTARQQDSTVQGLSSSASEVAAAVREITATSKELSSTMDEVNGRAGEAAKLASQGRKRLVGMEKTMGGLVESTASISAKLSTIREKADNINVVVTTITKVADQTNLLSINAAIEAEKAGEYGRGFLVVAREIRRLADQTAVATLDIESMVRHMQEAVSTGVMQMDKFSDDVRSGTGRVAEVNSQTGQIIDQVDALTERFHQVTEGMRNQSIGAEQINEAMASMTGNIRQTAGSLEEFNRATAHLRGAVEALNAEIAQFKV
ncbi:MAG: methyl-accepting chemotaxis protein [Gemmataceae bacterium]|nr:methyl-accepting chemotaxis protein [Gemmataceae bacterium]